MLESLVNSAIEQIPSLGLFAAMAIIVLRFMNAKDRLFMDALEKQSTVIRQVSEQCHRVQRESSEAMRESSATMAGLQETIRNLGDSIRDIDDLANEARQSSRRP